MKRMVVLPAAISIAVIYMALISIILIIFVIHNFLVALGIVADFLNHHISGQIELVEESWYGE